MTTAPQGEELARLLLSLTQDFIFIHPLATPERPAKFLAVSDYACKRLGYTREELLGLGPLDLLAEEDLASVPQEGEHLRAEQALVVEKTIIGKGGERIICEIRASLLEYEGETLVISTAREITARKQAEEALKYSEARLQALSDASFEAVFLSDKGLCLDQNLTAEKMFGYTREEALGRYGTKWILPEDRERVMQNMLDGYEDPYEVTALRKDGTTFPCEIQGRMIEFQGRPIRVTALRDISARKRAEQGLKEHGDLLKNIIDSSTDFIYVKDRGLRTVICNQTFARAVGKTPGEMVGKTDVENGWDPLFVEGYPEKGIRGFAADDRAALAGETLHISPELSNVGDEVRAFDTIKLPLRDETGAIIGVLGISRDVTERRQAEESLKEREKRLAILFDNAADAMFVADLEGRLVQVNRQACESTGYSEAELLGMKVAAVDAEISAPNAFHDFTAGLASGRTATIQSRHRRKDGSTFPVEITINLLETPSGPQILGIARDISERLERELEYGHILKTATDGFWVVDHDGRILEANAAAAKMLGYTQAEMTGMTLSQIDIVEDLAAAQEHARRIREEGSAVFEARHRRKDGGAVDVEVSVGYLPIGRGRFIVFVRNITDRKRLEQEREVTLNLLKQLSSTSDLHHLLAEITALMRDWSGCEAVGIRLNKGEDFPYFETRGFPSEFVRLERSLCAVDRDGEMIRDEAGTPYLECMCGNVIQRRFDPSLPFFTAGGSFWTNSTTELLASTSSSQRQGRTRNRCHGEGYESVALVPLRHGDEVLGLLQFNDPQRGRFDPERIALFERLAANLALGLVQRRAVEALRASEDRYRTLYSSMNELFVLHQVVYEDGKAVDYRIIDCNAAFTAITGLDCHEAIGRLATEVYGTDEAPYLEIYARTAATGEPQTFDTYFPPMDKHFNVSVFSPTQGQFATIALDITKIKKAEEALRDSEERFRSVLENIPDGVFTHDLDGNLIIVNEAASRDTGYSLQELLTMNVADIDPESLTRKDREQLWQTLNRGDSFRLESQHRRRDGSFYPVELRLCALTLGDQPIILGVVQDITQRKRAEEIRQSFEDELHRRNQFIETILDNLPIGLAVNQMSDGETLYMNRQCEEIYGWPREDIGSIEEFFQRVYPDPDYRQQIMTQVMSDITSGDPARMVWEDVEATGKDGSKRIIYAKNIPLPDQDLMISTAQDTTRRKELEGQLRQAQKMEAVGTLAGGIAHDFNNILSAITGYSELALEAAKEGQAAASEISQVIKAADRAKELVQKILTFSRKAAFESKVLDLNKVVGEAVHIMERTLPKMIAVETHLADDLKPIDGDPSQIEQVLLNLASNAQDAMPDGGRLLIETRNVTLSQDYADSHLGAAPGDYLLLTVSDTGTGVAQEDLDHIFEPFFTTKEIGKGTGLGLASVFGIVKGHGGHINCYSEAGLGTSFKIYLPALEAAGPPAARAQTGAGYIPGGGEAILLVDDEGALREIGARLLRSKGYKVHTAASGEEALEIYCRQGDDLDLVIMDLGMPGIGGHKALKEILSRDPEARVVIASGYSANGQVKDALESGAAGYVAKPFRRAELLQTVRQVLDKEEE